PKTSPRARWRDFTTSRKPRCRRTRRRNRPPLVRRRVGPRPHRHPPLQLTRRTLSRKRLPHRRTRRIRRSRDRIGPVTEPADSEISEENPDDADVEHYHFRIGKDLERRLDQYLVDRVPYLSRNGVQRLIDLDLVKVNGKPTKASKRLKAGDEVEMVAPPKPVSELVPEPIPLDII